MVMEVIVALVLEGLESDIDPIAPERGSSCCGICPFVWTAGDWPSA